MIRENSGLYSFDSEFWREGGEERGMSSFKYLIFIPPKFVFIYLQTLINNS
jgi:hypothetical protein